MNDNQRIAKNTLLLYIRMLLILLINLYMSRVVLEILGIVDYGIYNIVGSIVVLFSFLNAAISNASQRFFNVALGEKNKDKVQMTFNVCFTMHIYIAFLVFILSEIVGTFVINFYLDIPHQRLFSANVAFQFSILTFVVQIIRVPFNCCVVAYERMSFYAYNSLLEVGLRLLLIYFLNIFPYDKLELYAILMFLVSFLNFYIYKYYCIHFNLIQRYVWTRKTSYFSEILHFLSWSMLTSMTISVTKQVVNMALNVYIGVIANAAIGISTQLNSGVYSFVSNFQLAFNPRIMKLYAENQMDKLKLLLIKSSKYSLLLMLLFSVPLMFNMEFVVDIWLNQVPIYVVVFSQFAIIESIISSVSTPLTITIHAIGNIKRYSIVMTTVLLSNIPIAYILLYHSISPYYVIAYQILVQFILCLYRFKYVNRYIQIGLKNYVRRVINPVILTAVISCAICFYISRMSLGSRFLNVIIEVIIVGLVIMIIGISSQERISTLNFIKSYLHKK